MRGFNPRKLKFKAWNMETSLLMRLDNISCVKGELVKHNHIILQYTGVNDQHHEELYEMDIVLMNTNRQVIQWSPEKCGWYFGAESGGGDLSMLTQEAANRMVRLCSYFESFRK